LKITLKNIVKRFDKTPILEIDKAEFDSGSQTVIMGDSGLGKSTLLNLIAGVIKPEEGDVTLGDTCISNLKEHQRDIFRSKNVGYVFQNFNLLPELTVLENIRMATYFGKIEYSESHVNRLMEQVGMQNKANAYPNTLSAGQKQRVAIVRAIVNKPGIILADEPTGALDQKNKNSIINIVQELSKDVGCTLILVTHDNWVSEQFQNTLMLADLNKAVAK